MDEIQSDLLLQVQVYSPFLKDGKVLEKESPFLNRLTLPQRRL